MYKRRLETIVSVFLENAHRTIITKVSVGPHLKKEMWGNSQIGWEAKRRGCTVSSPKALEDGLLADTVSELYVALGSSKLSTVTGSKQQRQKD